jgi:hypothetical protein
LIQDYIDLGAAQGRRGATRRRVETRQSQASFIRAIGRRFGNGGIDRLYNIQCVCRSVLIFPKGQEQRFARGTRGGTVEINEHGKVARKHNIRSIGDTAGTFMISETKQEKEACKKGEFLFSFRP